jgi:hypothetical protein
MVARGSITKVKINSDDAVDLGLRKIERVGDQRNCGFVHITEFFLQCIKDGEERAEQLFQFPDPRKHSVEVPRLSGLH